MKTIYIFAAILASAAVSSAMNVPKPSAFGRLSGDKFELKSSSDETESSNEDSTDVEGSAPDPYAGRVLNVANVVTNSKKPKLKPIFDDFQRKFKSFYHGNFRAKVKAINYIYDNYNEKANPDHIKALGPNVSDHYFKFINCILGILKGDIKGIKNVPKKLSPDLIRALNIALSNQPIYGQFKFFIDAMKITLDSPLRKYCVEHFELRLANNVKGTKQVFRYLEWLEHTFKRSNDTTPQLAEWKNVVDWLQSEIKYSSDPIILAYVDEISKFIMRLVEDVHLEIGQLNIDDIATADVKKALINLRDTKLQYTPVVELRYLVSLINTEPPQLFLKNYVNNLFMILSIYPEIIMKSDCWEKIFDTCCALRSNLGDIVTDMNVVKRFYDQFTKLVMKQKYKYGDNLAL